MDPKIRLPNRRLVRWPIALVLAAALPAQTRWARPVPAPASTHLGAYASAYDPVRQRIMMLTPRTREREQHDLWHWNGSRWERTAPATSIGNWVAFGLVADPVRNEVLLLGSRDGLVSETWIWNGSDWEQRSTTPQPPARHEHVMACDTGRGCVVLYAGSPGVRDTWEWDGASWTLRTPAVAPRVNREHALAYDAARGRTVLFGGFRIDNSMSDETWEWDGVNWSQRLPAISPLPQANHGMAYDSARQRVVMLGPFQSPTSQDTWEWDGTSWLPVPSPIPLLLAGENRLVEDVGAGCIVHASSWQEGRREWDGALWRQRSGPVAPPRRCCTALVYQPWGDTCLLFGGQNSLVPLGDTWEWNGAVWIQRAMGASTPPRRSRHAMAHDVVRGATVLFGGIGENSNLLGDTWEWDGSRWSQRQASIASPSSRFDHAMSFDPPSQRVLLFGGAALSTEFDDTWTWDGSNWTRLQPAVHPSARAGAVLSWDSVGQQTILFGGALVSAGWTPVGETWAWRGGVWQRIQTGVEPARRWGAAAATDPTRGAIVLHGGYSLSGSLDDTWEWDGASWSSVVTPSPYFRTSHAMTFDLVRRQVVMFGGSARDYSQDTWVYGLAGVHEVYGTGCAGSLGVPALTPSPTSRPQLGGRVVAELANVPNGLAALALDLGSPGSPLPGAVSLTAIGMPGCSAWLAPSASLLLATSGTVATAALDVPWNTALNGMQLFEQALVLDPPANAGGLSVSNAARVRIGN